MKFGVIADTISGVLRLIVLCCVAALLILPLSTLLIMSFDARDYMGQFPPPNLSVQWYQRFFSDQYYVHGLIYSAIVALLSSILATTIGLTAAIGVVRSSGRVQNLMQLFVATPLIVPGVVVGFALLMFFSRAHIDSGAVRIIAAHVLIALPFTFRTCLVALVGIGPRYGEAASTLGANAIQAFFSVTLPLARTGVVVAFIFALAISLDDVAVSLFLSAPDFYTLPVALISMMRSRFDLTIAAASSLFVFVAFLLVLVLEWLVGVDWLASNKKIVGS